METKPDKKNNCWPLAVGRWLLELKSKVQGLESKISPSRSSVSRPPPSALRPLSTRRQAAFTLIELLVAMAILMIIVLMLSNLFQASTRSWDTGMRQAEIGLEARAAISLIQQDLSQAIASSNYPFSATDFYMFSRTNASIERVTYTGGGSLTRNGVQLLGTGVDDFTLTPLYAGASDPSALPDLVEISLVMSSSKNFSEARVYVQGRGHDQSGIDQTDVIDTHRDN